MKIVGVDCATVEAKIGLALGVMSHERVELKTAALCGREHSAARLIARWLSENGAAALLAIDAPLGWPKPLAETLINHSAGAAIETSANAMFRRATDIFIQQKLKKTPLDVGADRIARTAHAALHLLRTVRAELGLAIPLAWEPAEISSVTALEVYPAATLVAHGFRSGGYKKREQMTERREIMDSLKTTMDISLGVPDLSQSADLVDAAVCVLAGVDFASKRAMHPEDFNLAQREGWIWAASPEVEH